MKLKKYIALIVTIFLLSSPAQIVSAQTTGNTTANITFLPGTLTLNEMSTFTFGTYTISATLQTYPAQETSVYLDVNDLRGTGEGWKVTALASRFSNGANPTLPGAAIKLMNGAPVSSVAGANAPNVVQNISLDCDGVASADIATAAVNHGLGVWTVEWNGNSGNNTNATLSVPGGVATIGTHTASITWTLANAP